jgi:hypothetical protein
MNKFILWMACTTHGKVKKMYKFALQNVQEPHGE